MYYSVFYHTKVVQSFMIVLEIVTILLVNWAVGVLIHKICTVLTKL